MESLDKKDNRPTYLLILAFVLLAAGIITAGYLSYRNYANQYRVEVERQLSVIADLKVGGLTQWRKERFGDAAAFYGNEAFSSLVRRYFNNPNDLGAQRQLWTWLSKIQIGYSYVRLLLFDARGAMRMSVPDSKEPVASSLAKRAIIVMRSEQRDFHDFYRDELDQRIYLTIMIPILSKDDGGQALGAIALRIDPESYLYPYISYWPTPSKTAETLLTRREGNEVVFLNELRFQKDTALKLRVLLEKIELPSVKATMGQEGIVEGTDYRGVPVIAAVRTIPDSPWFLTARMDLSEIYGPLNERLWLMIILVVALLIGIGTAIGLIWRQQHIRFYRERHEASAALRESEERYRNLYKHLRDGVAAVDMYGVIIECNRQFLDMLGYSFEEVGRLAYSDITPERWHAMEGRILKEQVDVRGYSDLYEKEYIRKDGTVFPIELQTYLVRNDHGDSVGYWAFIRDISDRKRDEETLRGSEEKYKTLAEKSMAGVYVVQNGKFRFINSKAASYAGYTREELLDREAGILISPEDKEKVRQNTRAMLLGEMSTPYEFRIITKQGETRWIMETVTTILHEGRPAILGNSMDITSHKQMEEEIRTLSLTDPLTGLYNRRGFLTLAEQQLKITKRTKIGLLLLFADIDDMKWINDNLGHKKGDEALIEAANVLKKVFRDADIVARVGGDEFSALALGIKMEDSKIIEEHLQYQIGINNSRNNREYSLSMSVGIAYNDPENPSTIDELMSHADVLMYEQKKGKLS